MTEVVDASAGTQTITPFNKTETPKLNHICTILGTVISGPLLEFVSVLWISSIIILYTYNAYHNSLDTMRVCIYTYITLL